MSIKLNVEGYCQNCDKFKAKVEHRETTACHPVYGPETITDHIVKCEHSDDCDRIYRYIKHVEGGLNRHDNFLD